MRRLFGLMLVFAMCAHLGTSGCTASGVANSQRPQGWAWGVKAQGLPNLHKVDEGLYRGAQPTKRGMKSLERLKVKTVVNLRSMHGDKHLLQGRSLDYVRLAFDTTKPEMSNVLAFLRVATDPKKRPVFVHCKHGADRTGMMVAFYRIVVQEWSKKDAIREMRRGGFGFHPIWGHLIRFIKKADIAPLKRALRRDGGQADGEEEKHEENAPSGEEITDTRAAR